MSRFSTTPSTLNSNRAPLSNKTNNADLNSTQIDGLAPTFQKKPSIKHENNGRSLVFECLVLANPKPSVKWLYNGLPLDEANARFSVSDSSSHINLLARYDVI